MKSALLRAATTTGVDFPLHLRHTGSSPLAVVWPGTLGMSFSPQTELDSGFESPPYVRVDMYVSILRPQ